MTHIQGDAVIIVNIGREGSATGSFPYREGAKKEKDNLKKVFVERFKFKHLNQDILNDDLSLKEWHCGFSIGQQGNTTNCKKCIICLIAAEADPQSKYFVLAITSHGFTSDGEQFILMRDGETFLALKDVIATLKSCQNLAEKTVIISIEACRAARNAKDAVDPGLQLVVKKGKTPTQLGHQASTNVSVVPTGPEKSTDHIAFLLDLPENFVVINGTTANRLSYRDVECGSWFEDALQDEIEKLVKAKETETMEVNFLKLLTTTAWNVSQREAGSVTGDMSRLRITQPSDSFLVTQGQPEISASVNVVADRCATPGSKCCIQIVHRLTKPIKLRL